MADDPFTSKPDTKQTEWDSSYATLKRIDMIITGIHRCYFIEDYFHYLSLVERLFVESRAKMDMKEKDNCVELQNRINKIKNRYGSNLRVQHINSTSGAKISNSKYILGWSEIIPIIKEYELYLMEVMDRHNMLMRDAKDGMTMFRGGGMK